MTLGGTCAQTVTVMAWAGYAQWSRTQLLGEAKMGCQFEEVGSEN